MPFSKTLIAVDTGGTFTDFYILTTQGILTHKVLSTPKDPSQAIARGLRELKLKLDFELVHGTTVATNALLTRRGARVALVTTEGFEDLIEIGRQNRPKLYRWDIQRPAPLVPSSLRFGLGGRLDASGSVIQKLDRKGLKDIRRQIRTKKVESIAVGFLFSFTNPRHEKEAAQLLKNLNLPLSLSSEICPEYREYERFSTACINAYVAPLMARYLHRLEKRIPKKIRVMQSNGGSLSIQEASSQAVRTLLSGPAGGALGALRIGSECGQRRLLSLDIGGTSTDLSLIDGDLELTSEAEVGAYPVKTPMIRIDTIGAGGGSIARLDAGGALRVGPESAGARPGPIIYGHGGTEITLTDAHVALGRIAPEYFLGGKMKLYPKKIRAPFLSLAKIMNIKPVEAAEGIVRVANSNIVRAMRVISLERGHDPRNFTLIAFGGAGPLHACELAEALEMKGVLIPHDPGLLSAYGMAHADWVRDYVLSILAKDKEASFASLKKRFERLEAQAFLDARREGIREMRIALQHQMDVRYEGQSYELTVNLSPNFPQLFEALHRKNFGYTHAGRPIEVVNLRLQARVGEVSLHSPGRKNSARPFSSSSQASIQVFYGRKWRKASLFDRSLLQSGALCQGPAVIIELSATTFVPPGWKARCDEFNNLVIKKIFP
jgi:N-methylhydantoinase A